MVSKVANNTLSVTLLSKSCAIAQLLQQQILAAIKMEMAAADWLGAVKLTPETIPLHRLPDDIHIIYRSPIAFKLAPVLQCPAFALANQLMAAIVLNLEPLKNLNNFPEISQTVLNFNVEVIYPGWINFGLPNQELGVWLQQLIDKPLHTNSVLKLQKRDDKVNENLTDTFSYFGVQYAHARCCSLLRMAHQQGLITLKAWEGKTAVWQIVEPQPIPWLNDEQEAATGLVGLRLGHPAEKRLIALVLDIVDAIDNLERQRGLKFARALSQAFEEFYSSCRIWGEVKTQTPKLAQARLGLVAVTQGLLRSLQDDFGVPVAVEL